MGFYNFKNTKISGISVVVPKKEISIFDEVEYYDNSRKKVERLNKIVGFNTRRVVDDDVTPSDLAFFAASKLIEKMSIDKESIDGLVFIEQRLSYGGPIDAYELHHNLGLNENCYCTSALQGCAGWVWGVFLCSQMIESRTAKKILLVCADTPSVGIDISDRNQAPLFGDAGSATLIEFSEDSIDSFFGISTYSAGFESIIRPAGGCRLRYDFDYPSDHPFNAPLTEEFISKAGFKTHLLRDQMDGGAVFEFTMNQVPEQIKKVLEYSGISVNDISKCCLHQANKQIVQTVSSAAGFPSDLTPYSAFEKYGNNTMCTVPTVLCDQYEINQGCFENKPYLCSGFGNGLVVATSILDLCKTISTGVLNYEKPSDFKNREQWITYWKNKVSGNI